MARPEHSSRRGLTGWDAVLLERTEYGAGTAWGVRRRAFDPPVIVGGRPSSLVSHDRGRHRGTGRGGVRAAVDDRPGGDPTRRRWPREAGVDGQTQPTQRRQIRRDTRPDSWAMEAGTRRIGAFATPQRRSGAQTDGNRGDLARAAGQGASGQTAIGTGRQNRRQGNGPPDRSPPLTHGIGLRAPLKERGRDGDGGGLGTTDKRTEERKCDAHVREMVLTIYSTTRRKERSHAAMDITRELGRDNNR